jgi:hypothetical protein
LPALRIFQPLKDRIEEKGRVVLRPYAVAAPHDDGDVLLDPARQRAMP